MNNRPAIGKALALAVGGWLTVAPAQAQQPAPAYDTFRLVRLRNMFDPDRRGIRGDAPAVAAPRAGGPLANYITFTGAMVTNGRKLAFFSGARPEYNKVIGPRDRIADFVVNDIAADQVQLRLGDKTLVVAVGQNVPLAGSAAAGQPGLQPPPEVAPLSATAAAPAASSSSSAAAPPVGGSDDVLRRMMERRQKETVK